MSKADFSKTVMPYVVMALLVIGGGATAWGIFGALGSGKNSAASRTTVNSSRQEAAATPGKSLERGEAFESEEREEGVRHERGERDDD
jgi:hypothetical protein